MARKVVPSAFEYRPDYALWSDGADKRRWIVLPEGGEIDSSDMAHWVFPLGTKFFKEFSRKGKKLETRLIERVKETGFLKNDYFMGTFIWRADQSDAILTAEGRDNVLGTEHDVPRQKDCIVCHQGEPGGVLGFSAVQLSASGTLTKVERKGWLSEKPGRTFEVSGDDLQKQAFGAMHANCGHCHAEMGMADFMHLRILPEEADRKVEELDAYRTTVGVELSDEWEDHPEQFTMRVVPGDPDASAIVYRMGMRGDDELVADQMPPLATREVDEDGLAAVRKWIESLAGVEIDAGVRDAGEGDAGQQDASVADAGTAAADGGAAGEGGAGAGGSPAGGSSGGSATGGTGASGGPIGPAEENPPVVQPTAAGAGGEVDASAMPGSGASGEGAAGSGGAAGAIDGGSGVGGDGAGASGGGVAGAGGSGEGAAGRGESGGASGGSGAGGDGAAGSGATGGTNGGSGVGGEGAAGSGEAGAAAGGSGSGVGGEGAAGSGVAGEAGVDDPGSGAAGTAPSNGGGAGSEDSDVPVDEAAEHDKQAGEQAAVDAGPGGSTEGDDPGAEGPAAGDSSEGAPDDRDVSSDEEADHNAGNR